MSKPTRVKKTKPLINGGAIDLLTDVAAKKGSMPILYHALYSNGRLVATDMDVLVDIACPADLMIVKDCALPLERLRKALAADPGHALVTPEHIDQPAPPTVPEPLANFLRENVTGKDWLYDSARRAFVGDVPAEVATQAEAWSVEHMPKWSPSERDSTPGDALYTRLRVIADRVDAKPAPTQFFVTVETLELTLKLETLDAADFPTASGRDSIGWIHFDAADFRGALDAVLPAASTDEKHYNLNTIFVRPHDGGAMFVATDGHRLHLTELPAEHVFPTHWPAEPPANERTSAPAPRSFDGFLLPRRLCEILVRRVSPVTGERVSVQLRSNFVEVKVGDVRWIAREIDGQFPDYEQVIPTGHDWQIDFDAATLDAAAGKLAKATGVSQYDCGLCVSLGGAAESFVSLGDAKRRDPIGVVTYEPPDVPTLRKDGEPNPQSPFVFGAHVGLNFRYLREALEALGAGAVRLRGSHYYVKSSTVGVPDPGWSASNTQTVLTRADGTGPTVILMPMAL